MGNRPLGIVIIATVLAVSRVFQNLVGLEALEITSFGLAEATDAAGGSGWAAIIGGVASIIVAGPGSPGCSWSPWRAAWWSRSCWLDGGDPPADTRRSRPGRQALLAVVSATAVGLAVENWHNRMAGCRVRPGRRLHRRG